MNKKELAQKLARTTGLTNVKAMEVVNAIFAVEDGIIAEELATNAKVVIPGFGTFAVKDRAARTGTNPSTGDKIEIAAKRVPAFKAGTTLEERVSD
ncbi:MAG: HU family DNA-binding protein [Alphaproteobacteria bacterium]|nr:HU family DNA-binding protein [Alphaproteobacteria bacterium]